MCALCAHHHRAKDHVARSSKKSCVFLLFCHNDHYSRAYSFVKQKNPPAIISDERVA